MDTISGLPSHPLFVHAPVVLMPMAMLASIAMALRPRWRRQFGLPLVIGAAVTLVFTQLAIRSGDSFDELVQELSGGGINTDDHRSLALATRILVALFFVAACATALLDRRVGKRNDDGSGGASGWQPGLAMAVTVVTAVLATIWMVRTGDEGARLVWDGIAGG